MISTLKKTLRNIRKAIKEELHSEYPWYTEKEFQAELRYELKELEDEGFVSVDHYFNQINSFVDYLNYYLIKDSYDRKNIESIIKGIFSESWHYIEHDEHRENEYLIRLHKKLVKKLKKIKTDNNITETINKLKA